MSGYTGDAKYVGPEKIVVAMDIGTTQSGSPIVQFDARSRL
jgi:hypothetical protein